MALSAAPALCYGSGGGRSDNKQPGTQRNMVANSRFSLSLQQQSYLTSLIVIVVPYVLYVIFEGPDTPPLQMGVVLLLGVIYLGLNMYATRPAFDRVSPFQRDVYFAVQCGLLLAITLLCPPGYMWLIGMPLVGTVVEHPSALWRLAVYAVALAAATAPQLLAGGWDTWPVGLLYAPAIVFVVFFTRLSLVAQAGQDRAEDLARQLEAANHQLAEYAVQAEELATTQERNRIAREIHDNLGHYLTVVNVQIEAAKAVMAVQPDRARDALDKAQKSTQDGLAAVRRSVAALRESPIANRPIPDAIAALIAEAQSDGLDVRYTVTAAPRDLHSGTALALYRVAQEALTNVRKHARAAHVDVALDYSDPARVRLAVHDDGVGSTGVDGGFGLLGIRERVNLLGGDMRITTAPGGGFQLAVTVPG